VLTRDLVAALLKRKKYEPAGVAELLVAHEEATSAAHDVADLTTERSVQQLLSSERHEAIFQKLMAKSTPRSSNLMLACSLPHASDWLLAPPIAGLGLALSSVEFRTALKFRLGIALYAEPFPCPVVSNAGLECDTEMDVFGDHAICCCHGTSYLFRHNNVRDILGHSARAAGLSAVVIEQKNQSKAPTRSPVTSQCSNTTEALPHRRSTSLSPTHCRNDIFKLRWRREGWLLRMPTTGSFKSRSRSAAKKAFSLFLWPGSR
jgi:hypothetical protein